MRFTRSNVILITIILVTIGGAYHITATELNKESYHFYIKGIHLYQGYAFTDLNNKESPHIFGPKDSIISVDLINDDKDLDSYDFNIDALSVHSNPIPYPQHATINFLAGKEGTFTYYSKLHPDMNGIIIVKSTEDPTIIKHS